MHSAHNIKLSLKPLPQLHSCRSLSIVRVKRTGSRFVTSLHTLLLISDPIVYNGRPRVLEVPLWFRPDTADRGCPTAALRLTPLLRERRETIGPGRFALTFYMWQPAS